MTPLRTSLLVFMSAMSSLVAAESGDQLHAVVKEYCADCHDGDAKKGSLNLVAMLPDDVSAHSDAWEKVVRKLRARQMPPIGKPRPDDTSYEAVENALEGVLDRNAMTHPMPGRTDTIRRLNRTEYQNVIRDLLGIEVDAAAMLPPDESSHGFDNVTVGELSPTLLDRYITAAQKISRLAVGSPLRVPGGETIRIPADITQEQHVEGLPLGTRGGGLISYTFPVDGDYEVQVRLTRDRNEHVEGLNEPHELVVLLDGAEVKSFTVKPPAKQDNSHVDDHLKLRFPVAAGSHKLGITFLKNPSSLQETLRQPYNAHFNMHRHPRISPAVYQVSITGPFDAKAGESPSHKRIFIAQPHSEKEELSCAKQILAPLMRRGWRRPVNDADMEGVLAFFQEARKGGTFDGGIEAALSAILVSREFLFRVESDPPNTPANTVYRISDLELSTRLSFFLWSSVPDDELLSAAVSGELRNPEVLAAQVRRMLADPRAHSLVSNFADQWLYLRNLSSITPDGRLFPDFDDNLRQAFRRETEMLFESIVREDRSVLGLIKSNYTFLNERLAKHYGIPGVFGSHFRRIELGPDSERGGLLRQGSILTVTSYATRTSPVVRGNWILGNLLGTPPPPPPPNVPVLDNTVSMALPMRERLAKHRANAACASCHNLMDPIGFALENFDAIGRWRIAEDGKALDVSGGMPDGSAFQGVAGLEQALLKRPEIFVGTLTEKLFTFALGRGVEPFDAPAVRDVVRQAAKEDFRFSAIVVNIVTSTPFRMRTSL